MNAMDLLLLSLCLLQSFLMAQSQKTCPDENTVRIVMDRAGENSTCGIITGRVEVCSDSVWKTFCDSEWTKMDAAVACRELGYSAIGADTSDVLLENDDWVNTVPVCTGYEETIASCDRTNTTSEMCSWPGVMCFVNDSAPSICFNTTNPITTIPSSEEAIQSSNFVSTASTPDSPATSISTITSNLTTVQGSDIPPNFLTTPHGIAIVAVVIAVIIFSLAVLLVVVLIAVCKKSSGSKLEQSRISPQDQYINDKDDKDDSDGKQSQFNNSPEQSRCTGQDTAILEHHVINADPLYEAVKDVPVPASLSSHDSGDSSDGNPPPTYSTLERDTTMPTYSTLEQSHADYAQVQPFINNGSLPRGGSLPKGSSLPGGPAPTTPVGEDVYHTLDRSTSQSSFHNHRTPSTSSLPKTGRTDSSPKQTHRTVLESITDSNEIPVYAELEAPLETSIDASSMVSTNAVVSQRISPNHSSNHRPLRSHASVTVARPQYTLPVKKSNTLPSSGRSAPSLPKSRHRLSGHLDERLNGVNQFIDDRLATSNQDPPTTSWV